MLGLRALTEHTVSVTLEAGDGGIASWSETFTTGPLPEGLPQLEVLAHDPDRLEPGYLLFNATSADVQEYWIIILDHAQQPVWVYRADGRVTDVRQLPDGALLSLIDGWPMEIDLVNGVRRRWTIDVPFLHHEAYPVNEGLLTLTAAPLTVDYPLSPDKPLSLAPATITDDVVLDLAPDGAVKGRWSLAKRLDPTRIGWNSHFSGRFGFDWAHANAVIPHPEGGFVVSLRHQSALVWIDAEGALRWIFGTPDGWGKPWADHLLKPIGALTWPSHAHAPAWLPDGGLLLFDNGNHADTPYAPTDAPRPGSRVAVFDIDAATGTVTERWSLHQTATGREFSSSMGDADPLPETGQVLAVYGFLTREGGVGNAAAGRGDRSARIVVFDPDQPDDPPLDLRISTRRADRPFGVTVYRAAWLPSLWPPPP